jgi:GT2 family glycosyltransferase
MNAQDTSRQQEPTSGSASNPIVDLSIIIVSWNVRELLRDCLDSIDAAKGDLSFEVIVVDSDSNDGSPELVANEFPWVRLRRCEKNVGFPAGNNLGIEMASGRFLLFLNPDTRIIGDAMQRMIGYLDHEVRAGVVGPTLLNPDGSLQSSRRRFPSLVTAFVESTWLERYAPRHVLRHYYAEDLPPAESVEVDWLVGACMMVRGEAIAQVGGMDEAYFMYSEELDWCRRMKDAGWRIAHLPDAKVIHHTGKSSEQAVTARHINFQRAKLRYFQKYHGRPVAALLRLFLILIYGWQMLLEGAKGVLGQRRALRWQRVKAYWQVIRSGLRPAGQ